MPFNPMTTEDAALYQQMIEAGVRFSRMSGPRAAENGRIVNDIASRLRQYGRFASLRQRSYAEALVRWSQPEQMTPAQQARAEAASEMAAENAAQRDVMMSGFAVARIVQLLSAAIAAGLRFPKIRLRRGEWSIRIYPAPSSGRNAGCFYVKANRSLYCGLIRPDGGFVPSRECPLDVMEALREFNADPARVATAYGHATSNCCFCGRNLDDARSVAMGYGPICAGHYGLPWGEERAAQSVSVNGDPERTGDGLAAAVAAMSRTPAPRAPSVAPRRGSFFSRAAIEARRQRRIAAENAARREDHQLAPQDPVDEDDHFR